MRRANIVFWSIRGIVSTSYARGMAVHAHHGAERLKPERVRQAAQQLVAPVMVDDRFADHGNEPGHALGQPSRDVAAMQWQIGTAGLASHQRVPGNRDSRSLVLHYMGMPSPVGDRCRS